MKAVLWAEGSFGVQTSKMASGILRYGNLYEIVAVIDSTKAQQDSGEVLNGAHNGIPIVATLQEAVTYNPEIFIVGLAPDSCVNNIDNVIRSVIKEAIEAKLNIVSGMYAPMTEDSELRRYAHEKGVELTDVRKPSQESHVFKGTILNKKTKVLLTVGTNWSVGKMTTALELIKELRKKKLNVAFLATGQTGILCGAEGSVPLDNIKSDFINGAVENAVMELDNKGYDLIVVEGQGCITHPSGVGCPVALLHGSQPDYILMCHDLNMIYRKLFPRSIDYNLKIIETMMFDFPVPELVGISVISKEEHSQLEQSKEIDRLEGMYGVPVVDSRKTGVRRIAEELISKIKEPVL